jgi:hypothetical protein
MTAIGSEQGELRGKTRGESSRNAAEDAANRFMVAGSIYQ